MSIVHQVLPMGYAMTPHPLLLPGLLGWYRSAHSSDRIVDSGKVSQLNDLSGHGNHAVQTDSSLRYAIDPASVNGRDAFTATRSGRMQLMSAAMALSAAGAYVFCVGGATAETPFVASMSAANKSFALDLAPGGTMYAWGDGAGSYITMPGVGAATSNGSINAFGVCSATGGSSSVACFNSSRSTGAGLPGSLAIDGITNYTEGGDYSLSGTFCELIFGAAHLTADQIDDTMDYLARGWGTP